MAKISLNSHVNSLSGGSWTSQTINNIKYFVSNNKTSSSVSSIKCSFTTPYDNINVVVEIGSSSENNYDWCYIGKLDDSSAAYDNYLDRISGIINNGPKFKTVTINVAKAGTHFLIIGYRKDGSGNVGNDCGYFRLITTEVEKPKQSYIYCGTKTTVSEEPIVFSKDGTAYDKFIEYNDPNNMFQWQTDSVDDNYYSTKVSFKTTSDNTEITLIYKYHFNHSKSDKFYVSFVDTELCFDSNDYIYQTGKNSSTGTVTKKISIPKAGDHYINIGFYFYRDSYVKSYVYVGFSGTNVIKDTKILTPGNILANNEYINKVYVGSELIWEKSKYLWTNQPNLSSVTFCKQRNCIDKVTLGSKKYDKYAKDKTIILGGTNDTKTTYGFKVNDLIKNGYLFVMHNLNTIDMSEFPNPVNMNDRYNPGGNSALNTKFLKINPKINKETTSLLYAFELIGNSIKDKFDEPLINEHKACNIIGLDKLNTDNITNMKYMFYRSRIVGNLDFSNWATGKVTDMTYMFWDSNGSNKNYNGTEYAIENYSYLTGLNNWNLQSVTNMTYMFYNSKYYDFQDKELVWDTSKVTDMTYMFAYCNAYNFPKLSFDTRNVTNMAYMFKGFESYNDLKLNFTDTSKVTNMSGMFGYYNRISNSGVNYYNFSYLNYHGNADISCLDTSNVVNATNMFYGCKYITPDMIKNIRLPKAKDIKNMFKYAYMGGWDFVNNKTTYIDTIDLSSFDLSYINSFSSMKHAFAFGGYKEYDYDPESINTYINNLILDNWKCFKDNGSELSIYLEVSPFYGCKVTYCYMRGCNYYTKKKIKQMLGLNASNNTNSSCKYFIED